MIRREHRKRDSQKAKLISWASPNSNLLLCERPFTRTRRQAADWEEILTNSLSDKGLVARTHEELSKPSDEKRKSIEKMSKRPGHTFH